MVNTYQVRRYQVIRYNDFWHFPTFLLIVYEYVTAIYKVKDSIRGKVLKNGPSKICRRQP